MISMNIHRALGEKKRYEERIDKLTDEIVLIGYKTNSAAKEYRTHAVVDDFNKSVKSQYDKIRAYIRNYNKLSEAILASNAVTIVEIGGVKMTVADAISKKTSIQLEQRLLFKMKSENNTAINRVNSKNEDLEDTLMKLQEDAKKKETDNRDLIESTRKASTWDTVDPLNLKKQIETFEEEISKFVAEVDYVLSASNAATIIEVDIDEE